MAIFCCFLFAAILNAIAGGVWNGVPNAVAAVLTGLLWLWWRMKTQYVNAIDFRRQTVRIRHTKEYK